MQQRVVALSLERIALGTRIHGVVRVIGEVHACQFWRFIFDARSEGGIDPLCGYELCEIMTAV